MKIKMKRHRSDRERNHDRTKNTLQRKVLTNTGLPVLVQLVAMVTGAEWAVGGVFTMMGAATIVLLTAVDDFNLNAWTKEEQNRGESRIRVMPRHLKGSF